MTGPEIRAARERKGWTQEKLAEVIKVGSRTVGNWERGETIPKNRMAALEAVLRDEQPDPLASASDVELLAELMRRTASRGRAAG